MAAETLKEAQGGQATAEVGEFQALLKQSFKPRTKEAEAGIDNAVSTLVKQALTDSSLVKDDVLDTIQLMIARLDEKISAQLNEVIHAPEFQQLEGAWRGLYYLVNNSETDATLKLRVLNISKKEIGSDANSNPGAKWDQSELFHKLYGDEYDTLGGYPYGALIGDYSFDHHGPDVNVLRHIGKISAAGHIIFIASADPLLLGMDTWNDLPKIRDLSDKLDAPEYAAWKSVRESENSRYMALCMPRVLSRAPYGAKTNPVEEFAFEERTDGHVGRDYAWMNAAYAMGANINRAFKESGWTVNIRGVQSGGEVTELPVHMFPTDDGDMDLKCPTEIAIGDRREAELSKAGVIPLIHRKNTDRAAFLGAQSIYKPSRFVDKDDTASQNLSSRIPYMFAVSRFAHYLKVMVRDWVGSSYEEAEIQRRLQTWINQYIEGDPANASEDAKARRPLAAAQVDVYPDEENPGSYAARVFLRPHYQLEGMNIGLSLVSRLPNTKK